MRLALIVAGAVLILVGAIWIGQGTGYFPYLASSFMIDDSKWGYTGAATLMVGFLLVTLSRRC